MKKTKTKRQIDEEIILTFLERTKKGDYAPVDNQTPTTTRPHEEDLSVDTEEELIYGIS